jgi:hypothetical protein
MAEITMETYNDGKNIWTFKQDSYTKKWILYKDGKKIKTSQKWEETAKEVPEYAKKIKTT